MSDFGKGKREDHVMYKAWRCVGNGVTTLIFISALVLGDEFDAPSVLPQGKVLSHWIGGWVGPRVGLEIFGEKSQVPPASSVTILTCSMEQSPS